MKTLKTASCIKMSTDSQPQNHVPDVNYMDSLKTSDLAEWKRFIELWNTDVAQIFEWLYLVRE